MGQNSSPVSDTLLADLRSSLAKAVIRNPAGVLFFSGGLDTSILALLSPSTPALHICLDDGGPDLPFARSAALAIGLVEAACKILNEMATFAEAGVSERTG